MSWNKKFLKNILAVILVWSFILLPNLTLAAGGLNLSNELNKAGENAGWKDPSNVEGKGTQSIYSVVGLLINIILGAVGVFFLVLMISAGVTWMTAQGDKDKVGKAKKVIINSVVGLAIVLAAYVIVNGLLSVVMYGPIFI